MLTVRDVANKYGVTVKFLTLALEKIGYRAATPDSVLSAATVSRFDSEYGDKIRAMRPAADRAFQAESEVSPPRVTGRQPRPHVMRVAHAKVTAVRGAGGYVVKALMDEPGPVHAIDAAGTRDGDPWRGEVVPGAVHFYGGSMHSGPPASCGFVKVRAVLGDEFVPADDPVRAGQCPRCAETVREGKGFRNPPGLRDPAWCEDFLRLKVQGRVVVKSCDRRFFHDGRHRASDGSTWQSGAKDYLPPPPDEV